VVANLSGVDMKFAVFLSASCLYFVITLTIHDGGNDCRLVDLYVNKRPDWYAVSAPLSSPYLWAF
jgi:hypothetical protein